MKKLLSILFLFLSSAVFAGGVEFEYGQESGHYAPNSSQNVSSNYFVMTPHWDVNDFEVGLKFEQSRQNIDNASLENKLELQVQRDVFKYGMFKTAIQVGLGRDFNQSQVTTNSDFNYYQISIKPKYQITDKLAFETSYRYRNAFDPIYYFQSNTIKAGFSYEINRNYEFGLRYVKKFNGDEQANAVEGGINYNF